jgi:hypothetical protein
MSSPFGSFWAPTELCDDADGIVFDVLAMCVAAPAVALKASGGMRTMWRIEIRNDIPPQVIDNKTPVTRRSRAYKKKRRHVVLRDVETGEIVWMKTYDQVELDPASWFEAVVRRVDGGIVWEE